MFRGYFGDEAVTALLRDVAARPLAGAGPGDARGRLDDLAARVEAVAGLPGRAFFDRGYNQAYPLDLAVTKTGARRVASRALRESWLLTLVVHDLYDEGVPPARETVPWTEVAVYTVGLGGSGDKPAAVQRVDLTADAVEIQVTVTGRPVKVVLDPNHRLLDYHPENNVLEVKVPPSLRELLILIFLTAVAPLALLLGAGWVVRRRPKATKAPPVAGRAK